MHELDRDTSVDPSISANPIVRELADALRSMLECHGKPHREECLNDAAFEHAKAVDAQARAALALAEG